MKQYNVILVILLIMAYMLIIPIPTNALRYSMDAELSNVDASFIGEDDIDESGYSVAGVGELNGPEHTSEPQPTGAPLFAGGDGSAGNPYQISNVTELQWMGNTSNLDKHFVIVNDIDASGTNTWNGGAGFDPVSDSSTKFTGTLNGQGYNITDLFINRPLIDYVGLLGYIGSSGMVSDVSLLENDISGRNYVGGLVGSNDGTVNNSYATGNVSGDSSVGGLVGDNVYSSTVNNSYATGNVSGTDDCVGGLVGRNYGIVNNSYATGDVSGTDDYVGGFVGYSRGTVENCYATGNVSGTFQYVGGLVGYSYKSTVENCYATGDVSGSSWVGGLVGDNYEGKVVNSFYSINRTSVNDEHYVTPYGIYEIQFVDWLNNNKSLDIGKHLSKISGADSYEINSISDIKTMLPFATLGGYNFSQTSDLDLQSEPGFYVPVLRGGYNGGNHTISNLNLTYYNNRNMGLFGKSYGTIETLYLTGCTVSGGNYIGGLVGKNYGTVNNSYAMGDVSGVGYIGGLVGSNGDYETPGGKISNCYATGYINGNQYIGGLLGDNFDGTVENCYATGNVSGNYRVGGLVGHSWGTVSNCYATGDVSGTGEDFGGLMGYGSQGTVNNSYATGNVSGTGDYFGGLIGYSSQSTVTNSYATGNVSGTGYYVGGFVGRNSGTVENCYSAGKVTGNTAVGGFCGHSSATMSNCFFDNQTSGMTTSDGGTGRNTSQMKTRSTFTDVGWDFIDIWGIIENYSYPFFKNFNYSISIGDIVGLNKKDADEDEPYMTDYDLDIIRTDLPGVTPSINDISGTWNIETNASFLWINDTGVLNGTPRNEDVGIYFVNISIIEIMDITVTEYTNFTLTVHNTNDVPYIMSSPPLTATEEEMYNYLLAAGDNDLNISVGELLTYTLDSAPDGMNLDSATGLVQWVPTNDQACHDHTVIVNVSDIAGAFDTQEFIINVTNTNDDPAITSTAVTTAVEDEMYEYQVTASDDDLLNPSIEQLTFSLDTAPEGMTVESESGLILWLPTNDDVGSYWVNVTVSDLSLTSDSHNFTLTVINFNDAPLIISEPIIEATVLDPYKYQLNVTDVDIGDILTYTLDTCPENMVINEIYGLITWTPSLEQLGDNPVIVRVSDSNTSDTQEFNIIVTIPANFAPAITSEPIKSATVGEQYRYEVLAEDDNQDDVLEYSLVEHPKNMLINADSGVILWTPSEDQLGKHTIIVKVSDGKSFALQTFDIKVTLKNNKPEVTAIPEQTIMVGEKFSYQVAANDLDILDILTFRLENAPIGMVINSTGTITWVPNKEQIGKHTITLNVSDGKEHLLLEFTINVKKEDSTTGDFDTITLGIVIIVIISIIVLLAVAIIMTKRKKAQKEKDKLASFGIPEQEVLQPVTMYPPGSPQTPTTTTVRSSITATTLNVPQIMTAGKSTVPAQATSQLGAAPVPEVTGNRLPQVSRVQPAPQLPPATGTVTPEPTAIPQTEMPPEAVTPKVE